VGFEPITPAFERAKAFHALHGMARPLRLADRIIGHFSRNETAVRGRYSLRDVKLSMQARNTDLVVGELWFYCEMCRGVDVGTPDVVFNKYTANRFIQIGHEQITSYPSIYVHNKIIIY
jgi:hypothetical protein